MILIKPKISNQKVLILSYFVLITVNTQCAKYFAYPSMTEWWINTAFLIACVLLLLFTFEKKLKTVSKILAIPLSWLIHAILTIPAAFLLGILKYNPDQIRTAAEHRAIFVLASIPIILFVLKKSRIF